MTHAEFKAQNYWYHWLEHISNVFKHSVFTLTFCSHSSHYIVIQDESFFFIIDYIIFILILSKNIEKNEKFTLSLINRIFFRTISKISWRRRSLPTKHFTDQLLIKFIWSANISSFQMHLDAFVLNNNKKKWIRLLLSAWNYLNICLCMTISANLFSSSE